MAVTEKQRRAMNREIAQEQAMINRRLESEKYMQAEIEREAASRIPSVPTVANPMSADPRSANFIPTNQVGLLPRPPVTYTAEGSRMQTPPLSMPTAQALLGPTTEKLPPGYDAGVKQGDANRSKEEQLGFMDKIFSNPMLQRMMERSLYSQPTFGGNFISEQASGERGLRSVEAQSAELAQKKAIENNKIQATLRAAELKAGKGVKPDSTLANISKEYFKAKQGIDVATQIENLLPTGDVGGIAAVGENLLNAIMTSLGGNPDSSTSEKVLLFRGRLYETFSTGKEMSQGDKDIIEIIAPESGKWTVSNAKMKEALRSLKESYRNKAQFNKNYANQIYGRDISTLLNRDPKPKLNVSSVRPAK